MNLAMFNPALASLHVHACSAWVMAWILSGEVPFGIEMVKPRLWVLQIH